MRREPEAEGTPAGEFGPWLDEMRAALRGERDASVPCDGCTACCTSSQFVHIAPDETEALAHIPRELLFPAPGLPRGYRVLGYDERGHCPMLSDGRCSIYEHRPRTCRTFDCRLFAATGTAHPAPDVAARARRWRFASASAADRRVQEAVLAASRFVETRSSELPEGLLPSGAAPRAMIALEICELFLPRDGETATEPEIEVVRTRIEQIREAVRARHAPR